MCVLLHLRLSLLMMMLLLRFLLLFWVVGGGELLLIGVFVVFTLQSCGILVSLMGQGPSLSLTRSLVHFVYWCSCVCSLVWSRVSTFVALGSPCCLLPRLLVRSAVVCDCVANACGGGLRRVSHHIRLDRQAPTPRGASRSPLCARKIY